MEEPRETTDEARLRLAFKIISRQIRKTDEALQHLSKRQRRAERLALRALRLIKELFKINQN